MAKRTCPHCGKVMRPTGEHLETWIDSEPHGEWYERDEVYECEHCRALDFVHCEVFFVPDTAHDEYKDRL